MKYTGKILQNYCDISEKPKGISLPLLRKKFIILSRTDTNFQYRFFPHATTEVN